MAHLLIIDDDHDLLEILQQLFVGADYRVTTASDGGQAFAVLQSDPPDVVILDLFMPEVDGFEVYRMMRSNKRTEHIPVVVSTSADESTIKTLDPPPDAVINKPFDTKKLLEQVSLVLSPTPG